MGVLHDMRGFLHILQWAHWRKVHIQVLASSPPRGDSVSAFLPDGLPGQVHSSGSSGTAAGEPFSLFSVPIAAQREQTASRQQQPAQQPAQQSRFYDGFASAEQQVLMLSAIPMWNVAMYGPQAQSCQCWTFAPGFNDTFHAGGLSVC